MSKLIYSPSKAKFETAYSAASRAAGGAAYQSIAFTGDGYLFTHGQYFRIFNNDASNILKFVSDATNTVTVKDYNGVLVGTLDIGIRSITGTSPINASTTNGVTTITHATTMTAGSVGPGASSNTSIVVPVIGYNVYGHITSAGTQTATLNNVLSTLDDTGNVNYYLTGTASSATNTGTLVNASDIYFNPSTGVLRAPILYEGSSAISTLYAPIAHTSVNATSAVLGHVKLTDSTTDSTSAATGGWAASPKAIVDVLAASKSYTDTQISTQIAAADAMIFKGTLGTGGTITALPTTYKVGYTYRVITAGTYAGVVCEVGDLIVALIDRAGTGNLNTDWTVAQTNIDGAVTSSATLPAGALVLGNGSQTLTSLANAGTAGYLLVGSTGTTAPAWTAPGSLALQANGSAWQTYTPTSGKTVNFKGADAVAVTVSGNDITFKGTNTASMTSSIMQGSNSGTVLTYVPYTTQQAALLSFDTSTTNPVLNTRLNLNGYLWATKLYSGGVEVLTSHQAMHGMTFRQKVSSTYTQITSYNPTSATDDIVFEQGSGMVLTSTADAGLINIAHATPSGAAAASGLTQYVTSTDAFGHVTGRSTFAALSLKTPTNSAVDGTLTTTSYAPNASASLTLAAGSNVTISTAGGVATISSSYSWRDVKAYTVTAGVLSAAPASIGMAATQFSNDFVWDTVGDGTNGPELKLGWAEVQDDGTTINYTF